MKTLAGQSLELLEDAQDAAREQAEAYWDSVFELLEIPDRVPFDSTPQPYPRAVDNPLDVWTRPAEQYRYAKSQGATDEQAMGKALERADKLAQDDIMLTKRQLSNTIMKHTGAKYYRRVIHPELSETGTCGLCLAASTRRYSIKDLMPIHNDCNCETLPILPGKDPARLFNLQDLEKLYELAGGTGAAKLADVKYKIDEHGELGPYLVRKNRKTNPAKKTAFDPKKIDRRKSLEAQLKTYQTTIPQLMEDVKTDPSKQPALDWQRARVKKIQKELSNGR